MSANMDIILMLEEIQKIALKDGELKERFLQSKRDAFPLKSFCDICRELGYEIYPMEVIAASEEFYAAKKRSTNGGGENSPLLEGEDDLYEDFFAGLGNNR